MPFIPTPSAARVTLNFSFLGRQMVNVLHFGQGNPGSEAALNLLGVTVLTTWAAQMLPRLSNLLAFTSVTVRDISVQDGIELEIPAPGGSDGQLVSPALPSSIAFCVTHRTALTGRSRRGRTYVVGLVEEQVLNNQIGTLTANQLSAVFNAIREDVAADTDFVFSILSLESNGVPRALGVTTPVTGSFARDTRVDSQRRRLGR